MEGNNNKKRVVKNTLYLYLRMLLIMCVSLYTVRVVLAALGKDDYGINNVVGGVVTMFSFLTTTLVSASQRFFAFELGRNDYERLNGYFNATFISYIALSFIILLLAETLGLWFVMNKLTIPASRHTASLFVYQFAILTFVVKLYVIPYMSVIIARERMNVYAVVSVVEAGLQLLTAYLLHLTQSDKLVIYSILLFVSALIPSILYAFYAHRKFSETKLTLRYKPEMLRELVGYCGWNVIGTLSSVIRSQGINILLNLFFAPVVNAARAIAYQVNNAINQLSTSFFNAVKPQITKTYAAGESSNMMELVFLSSRFSYYLVYILSLPILLEVSTVLSIWLVDVPNYTVLFTRLVMVNAIVDGLSHPLMSAVQATGKIKYYQIVTGGLLLINLPISYCFLRMGYPPQITMIVSIIISVIAQLSRIIFMKMQLRMSVWDYSKRVLLVVLLVTVISSVIPTLVHYYMNSGISRLILVSIVSILNTVVSIWYFGISLTERNAFIGLIKKRISI